MEVKRNAVILAAGTSSRFVPLSWEVPKGLLEVRGEVLIERQIKQLIAAGVEDIVIVTGYKSELFEYLVDKFGVTLFVNEDYRRYNNVSSLIRVVDKLKNTYICSSDNYFTENVFMDTSEAAYYSALYSLGNTKEYCLTVNDDDNIRDVNIGGENAWYMIGHVYFSEGFSKAFSQILVKEYEVETNRNLYWEDLYIKHIKSLPFMKIRRYDDGIINEFDSIDELRRFDHSYMHNTRSAIIKSIAYRLGCTESCLSDFMNRSLKEDILRFSFKHNDTPYIYDESNDSIIAL